MLQETIKPIKRDTTWLACWLSSRESWRCVNCSEIGVKNIIRLSKEESSLYNKSWPIHDTKTISRKHPFNSQWLYWETAYLSICPYILNWTLWRRNCSKAHSEVLFYTKYFTLIILCNIFSNMKYRSLSLDTRNSPSVTVYNGSGLWHTLWDSYYFFHFMSEKAEARKDKWAPKSWDTFSVIQDLWVINSSHWKDAWGMFYFMYIYTHAHK